MYDKVRYSKSPLAQYRQFGNRKEKIPVTWLDGTFEPNYGFAKPYGSNDFYEDIATFTDVVINSPDAIRKAIHPKNDKEDPYKEIYLSKLELLLKYEFITEAQYNKVKGSS